MRVWKRIVSGGLCGALLAGLLTVGASAAGFSRSKTYTPGQFTDVAANAWYAASVKDCYELGLMSGSSATTFNPSGLFTLAEAATIAARMHNIYNGGNGTIPSAAGAWYQGAVDYCVKNGIVGEGQYSTYTRNATRAEMAGMMAAALPESAWTAKNNVTALPDVNPMTDQSEAIFTLYNAGVFTGSDAYGKFQPYAYITRAEVAAIAARCADEGQRKVLNLTPMSQAEAPVIPGSKFGGMSEGRLAFKDKDTGKWGYLDGAGVVVIPAQYNDARYFEDGYAVVKKDGNYGLIDLNGNVVVPLEYYSISSLGDGAYELYRYGEGSSLFANGRVVTQKKYGSLKGLGDGLFLVRSRDAKENRDDGYGVINTSGVEVLPLKYHKPKYNGIYIIGYNGDTVQSDIYDRNGTLLHTYAAVIVGAGIYDPRVSCEKNTPLLAVKDGEKYALATGSGLITQAIYDKITLAENSNLAIVKYGELSGLAGLNGEIFAPGTYDHIRISENYAIVAKYDEDKVWLAGSTGILFEATNSSKPYFYNYSNDGYFRVGDEAYDLKGNYLGTCRSVPGYYDDEENYFIIKKGKTYAFKNPSGRFYDNDNPYVYCNETGVWGYFDYNGTYHTGYETRDAATKAVEGEFYSIERNAAGKPYVGELEKDGSYTPVIEFYQNNMYYDEIEDIGEGYYACRFNTTWYLRHI